MSAEAWKITSAALKTLAGRLCEKATVIAPKRTQGGEYDYDVVENPAEICWDYTISLTPLKRFFLPQVEPLFEFSQQQGKLSLKPVQDTTFRVFLGIRSCDTTGVTYLDQAYQRDYEDPGYTVRRQNSLIISLACNKAPTETCFCVCGDGGPFLEKGYDVQLVAMGLDYLVEVGSPKGAAVIEENKDLFTAANEKDFQQKQKLMKQAEGSFDENKAYIAAAMRKLTTGKSGETEWEKLSAFCLGCTGCAYICPTCTCFTTFDRTIDDNNGVRERHWDACSLQCYSREASGHNPRKEQHQRLKSRFFHKLSYQFVLRNGRQACVCCGRCVSACYGESSMADVTIGLRRGE